MWTWSTSCSKRSSNPWRLGKTSFLEWQNGQVFVRFMSGFSATDLLKMVLAGSLFVFEAAGRPLSRCGDCQRLDEGGWLCF